MARSGPAATATTRVDVLSALVALLCAVFAEAGGTDDTAYDPYSLLRSTEDLLGIKALAKAKDAKSYAGTVLASAKVLTEGDG